MTEISAMYEALDNMDDYALMANVKPIGPHKVLTDAIAELEQLRQRVQGLTAERDALEFSWAGCSQQLKDACADLNAVEVERDKATQYWQIAEGRCDALKQQRDELVKAMEPFVKHNSSKSVIDLAIHTSDITKARAVIARVKEKQHAAD